MKFIVGIDEAGRGPLAGPVAVAAFCIAVTASQKSKVHKVKSRNFISYDISYEMKKLKQIFKGARDSKKMSAKKREEIFGRIMEEQKNKNIQYIVHMESSKMIDTKGISWAIKNCIARCLKKLKVNPKQTLVLLDGGIKAPPEFIYQKTIIHGDDKELVISLASICAKVTRDAHMAKFSKKYPHYGLEIHKGYGTLKHRTAIRKHGASSIHRKSFLRNI